MEQLGDMFGGVDAEQEEKQQVATQDEIQASIPLAKEPAARPVADSSREEGISEVFTGKLRTSLKVETACNRGEEQ